MREEWGEDFARVKAAFRPLPSKFGVRDFQGPGGMVAAEGISARVLGAADAYEAFGELTAEALGGMGKGMELAKEELVVPVSVASKRLSMKFSKLPKEVARYLRELSDPDRGIELDEVSVEKLNEKAPALAGAIDNMRENVVPAWEAVYAKLLEIQSAKPVKVQGVSPGGRMDVGGAGDASFVYKYPKDAPQGLAGKVMVYEIDNRLPREVQYAMRNFVTQYREEATKSNERSEATPETFMKACERGVRSMLKERPELLKGLKCTWQARNG